MEFRQFRVDFHELGADGGGLAVGAGGGRAARENAKQQQLGLGQLFVDFLCDGNDTRGDRGGSVAGVVGADHQHDDLGLDAVEFAVVDAPEHVLRLVTTDAEVRCVELGVAFLPHSRSRTVPARGDRVTDEEHGHWLSAAFEERLVIILERTADLAHVRVGRTVGKQWPGVDLFGKGFIRRRVAGSFIERTLLGCDRRLGRSGRGGGGWRSGWANDLCHAQARSARECECDDHCSDER